MSADDLINALWFQYIQDNPHVKTIYDLFKQKNQVENDWIDEDDFVDFNGEIPF